MPSYVRYRPGGVGWCPMRWIAARPVSFGAAFHSLFASGKLQAGQTVMIQGGAGGVGLAAIQLARQAGARVLATISSMDHWPQLQALELSQAIDYTKDVRAAVMDLTSGQGVDLVVDPRAARLLAHMKYYVPKVDSCSSAMPEAHRCPLTCGRRCRPTSLSTGSSWAHS